MRWGGVQEFVRVLLFIDRTVRIMKVDCVISKLGVHVCSAMHKLCTRLRCLSVCTPQPTFIFARLAILITHNLPQVARHVY